MTQIDPWGRTYRGAAGTALDREREEAAEWWPRREERAGEELDAATHRRERAYSTLTRAWENADPAVAHWWTLNIRQRLSPNPVTTVYPAPGQTVVARMIERIPAERIERIARELEWVESRGRNGQNISESEVVRCVARMWGVDEAINHEDAEEAARLAAARAAPSGTTEAGPAWDAALRIYERWTTPRMETLAEPPRWALDHNGRQRWWFYRLVEIEWCWAKWNRRAPIYAGAGWKEQIESGANHARRTGRLGQLANAIEWLHWNELNRRAGWVPWTARFWRRNPLTRAIQTRARR